MSIASENTTKIIEDAGNDWRELDIIPIDLKELAHTPYAFGEHPYFDGFVQTKIKGWDTYLSVIYHIYFDGTMVARTTVRNKEDERICQFFKFMPCKHENRDQTNLGNCWNKYICKDCGHIWEIDSSD